MYTGKRENIQTGWTNKVVKINTCGGDYIFRFPKTEFWRKVLITEYNNTKFLSSHIKTARQKLFYYNGNPYSVHKYIEGEPLSVAFEKMNDDQKQNIANQIMLYLTTLQKIDYSGKEIESLSSFLKRLAVSTGNQQYDYSTFYELEKQEKLGGNVICHGDFNADNILIKDNNLELVIDYAFCSISSPFADISRICNRLPAIRPYMLESIIKMWDYVDDNYKNYMLKGN